MGSDMSGTCWKCGRALAGVEYSRRESCPGCDAETRVCRNCRHYDPRNSSACREPHAELVGEKEKPNFCEFFQPGSPEPAGGGAGQPPSGERKAKDAFDSLFKKKPGS